MKTKHFLSVGIIGIGLAGLLFAGCAKKSSNQSTNTDDYTAAQDDQNALASVEDSKNIADGAAKGQANERLMSGCENITTRDTMIGSQKDTLYDVNFGPTDCTCSDYRKRRGHIFIYCVPGAYWTQGQTIGMTFKNYYVNDIGVAGTRTLTNVGLDSANLHTWSFSANLTLTYPNNGGTATWTSSRTNTLTKVNGNWYYFVTGNASGVSRKGSSYSINITSPLVVTAFPWWLGGCAYIESGTVTINVSSLPTITAVFGSAVGSCSSALTVTVNSHTYNLTQW